MVQDIFTNQDKYKDIVETAGKLNLTVEEYLIDLHDRNRHTRTVLLQESEEFKKFVNEYCSVVDSIAQYKQKNPKHAGKEENFAKAEFTCQLLKLQMTDIVLLTRLYSMYTKQEKKKFENETSSFS